jgi:CO/xanthine dehydrogenase FAD-binding subunit
MPTATELIRPRSLDEALDALAHAGGDATIMAGGVGVMSAVHHGAARPRVLVYLGDAGMAGARTDSDGVTLGATTSLLGAAAACVAAGGALATLADALGRVGTRAIQSQATIGGHLFSPQPYGDLLPILLVLDATVRIRSAHGSREVGIADLIDAGSLAPGELVAEIAIPAAVGRLGVERLSVTQGMGPAIMTVAAYGANGSARVAVNGAGPRAYRADSAEQAVAQARPEDDPYASAWYRRNMVGVLAERALRAARGGNA